MSLNRFQKWKTLSFFPSLLFRPIPSLLSPSPFFFSLPRPKVPLPAHSFFFLSRPSPLWFLPLSPYAMRGPPVRAFPYPGSGTDSAVRPHPSPPLRALARTPRGPAPAYKRCRPHPLNPSNRSRSLASQTLAPAHCHHCWSLELRAAPPFRVVPVDLKSPRSFASRWGSSPARFPPPSRSASPGLARRSFAPPRRRHAPCSACLGP